MQITLQGDNYEL